MLSCLLSCCIDPQHSSFASSRSLSVQSYARSQQAAHAWKQNAICTYSSMTLLKMALLVMHVVSLLQISTSYRCGHAWLTSYIPAYLVAHLCICSHPWSVQHQPGNSLYHAGTYKAVRKQELAAHAELHHQRHMTHMLALKPGRLPISKQPDESAGCITDQIISDLNNQSKAVSV